MQTWFRRLAAAMLLTVLPVYAAAGYYAWRLPDSYYVRNGSALALSTALHITAESEPEEQQAFDFVLLQSKWDFGSPYNDGGGDRVGRRAL